MSKKLKMLARKVYCYVKYKKGNGNYNPTIVSSNCIGGVVSSDMGLKFSSPTVNLYIIPKDFVKFCSKLEYYLNQQLKWVKEDMNCPVAMLDDITIYFLHYKTEEEAEMKWNERKTRVNYDNLYFIMTDRDGCTYEDLLNFDSLSGCKNKVVFTHKYYPEIKSAFYLKKFKKEGQVGVITKLKKFSWFRDLDEFDWKKFLN